MKPETRLKAEGYALAIQAVTGEKPGITEKNGMAHIVFTVKQRNMLQAMLERSLETKAKPADVTFEVGPIIIPVIVRKFGALMALVAGGLITVGRALK